MATLYRQYRPQTFGQLSGQEQVSGALMRAITTDHIAQAYLFYGPRGTGKTSTARILAKRLNCENPEGAEPCGQCRTCLSTQNGQNIDILEIDAASNRGIDDIRALKEGITMSPTVGKYKVYIIDEVHMLTNEAFTALLKTLEEPTAHAIFILATTELHKVPETILSRCQVYRFRRATPEEMAKRLNFILAQEKREVSPEALQFIIRRTDGCYRDAESLLGQLLSLGETEITLDQVTEFLGLPPQEHLNAFLTALIRGTSAPALEIINTVNAEGFDLDQFIKESITTARDGAVALAMGKTGQTIFETFIAEPQASVKLSQIIRALLQALQDLAYVPEPLIAVHLAILTLCTTKGETVSKPHPTPLLRKEREEIPQSEPAIAQHQAPTTVTVVETPTAVSVTATGVVSVEAVKKVWPQLIAAVKAENPVASTFLRAMEPALIEGSVVRLRARYALHRNYFDKPDNQTLLGKSLSQLLQTEITIRCFLEEAGATTPNSPKEPNTALLDTVKEVFGQQK